MLSPSRTTSSRRGDPTVLGMAKPTHRKSISWPTTARKRCIRKNFDGIHDRFQRDPVSRDSQLKIGWTEEKCITMDKLAQEDHSYCPSYEENERYRKNWTEQIRQKCTDETPIRLPNSSHNYEPSPPKIRRRMNQHLFINTKGCIRLLLLPVPHGGSDMKTGGAFFCCSKIVYS